MEENHPLVVMGEDCCQWTSHCLQHDKLLGRCGLVRSDAGIHSQRKSHDGRCDTNVCGMTSSCWRNSDNSNTETNNGDGSRQKMQAPDEKCRYPMEN